MFITCSKCGSAENKKVIPTLINFIGGLFPFGGYAAWVFYVFAGTGFAMLIVLLMIGFGVLLLAFKDPISRFIFNRVHKCPDCGASAWS